MTDDMTIDVDGESYVVRADDQTLRTAIRGIVEAETRRGG